MEQAQREGQSRGQKSQYQYFPYVGQAYPWYWRGGDMTHPIYRHQKCTTKSGENDEGGEDGLQGSPGEGGCINRHTG